MPVNSTNLEYQHWLLDWYKCRDAFDGQRAVKRAGPRYLPRLSEQTQDEYDTYKQRALFYSITSKSVCGLVGMATARPPITTYPEQMKSDFEDNSGTQFYEVLGTTIAEILLMGRHGLLVDRQTDGGKPRIHMYRAESIINWRVNRDGKASLVVLTESVFDATNSDEYNHLACKRYRVLRLVPKNQQGLVLPFPELIDAGLLPIVNEIGSDWIYSVSVYSEDFEQVSTYVPTNSGAPMNMIPFYIGNPFGIGYGCSKPPMLDIADINISHYCTSADLEHGRHFTGLPTAVVSGIEPATKLKIGSMAAWILPDKDAKASYLEFTGQGLTSLENAMKEKQGQMASLSSRILDNSANGSEASDAIRLRYMSESASLSSIVRTAEAMMNLAYKTIAAMEGLDPNSVSIKLEKEFHNTRMSPTELLNLTESYMSGGMSVETYVFNLRRADILPVDRTDQEEITELEKVKAALDVANAAKQSASIKPPPAHP